MFIIDLNRSIASWTIHRGNWIKNRTSLTFLAASPQHATRTQKALGCSETWEDVMEGRDGAGPGRGLSPGRGRGQTRRVRITQGPALFCRQSTDDLNRRDIIKAWYHTPGTRYILYTTYIYRIQTWYSPCIYYIYTQSFNNVQYRPRNKKPEYWPTDRPDFLFITGNKWRVPNPFSV